MFDLISNFLEHTQWHTHVCNTQSGLFHPMHQLSNCHVNIFATPLVGPAAKVMQKACAKISWSHFFHFAGSHQQFCKWKFLAYFLVSSNVDSDAKDDEGPKSHTWLQAQKPDFPHKLEILFRFYLFWHEIFPMHFFIRSEMSTERRVWKLYSWILSFSHITFRVHPQKLHLLWYLRYFY